jgi:glycosyltransferase involved in cell wall biosynthesis
MDAPHVVGLSLMSQSSRSYDVGTSIRILHLADRVASSGGADHYFLDLVAALAPYHTQRIAVGQTSQFELLPPGIEILRAKALGSSTPTARGLDGLKDALAWADVVHVHNLMNPVAIAWAVDSGRAIVTVQDHRSFCPGRGKERADGTRCAVTMSPTECRSCFNEAVYAQHIIDLTRDRLHAMASAPAVVLSRYMADELSRVNHPHVVIIPPSVPLRGSVQEGHGFLLGGRLVSHKGVDWAWQAWRDSGVDAPLRLAGSGPMESGLVGTESLGWLGHSALGKVLSESRALLFPARWQEPFGILGAEALAAGTPVIAMDTGGVSEWGQAGTIRVPRGDITGMAEAIRHLHQQPTLAVELGQAGRDYIGQTFGAKRFLQRWQSLLATRAASRGSSLPGC